MIRRRKTGNAIFLAILLACSAGAIGFSSWSYGEGVFGTSTVFFFAFSLWSFVEIFEGVVLTLIVLASRCADMTSIDEVFEFITTL